MAESEKVQFLNSDGSPLFNSDNAIRHDMNSKTYFTLDWFGMPIEVYAVPFFHWLGKYHTPTPQMEVYTVKDNRYIAMIRLGYGKPLYMDRQGNDTMGTWTRMGQEAIEGIKFNHPWSDWKE